MARKTTRSPWAWRGELEALASLAVEFSVDFAELLVSSLSYFANCSSARRLLSLLAKSRSVLFFLTSAEVCVGIGRLETALGSRSGGRWRFLGGGLGVEVSQHVANTNRVHP